jgi:hypothetical protein
VNANPSFRNVRIVDAGIVVPCLTLGDSSEQCPMLFSGLLKAFRFSPMEASPLPGSFRASPYPPMASSAEADWLAHDHP